MKVAATTRNVDPTLMRFDGDFWGTRVARATSVDGLSQWAAENTVGMIWLLIDADRPDEAQQAEENGFRFMDVRVKLEREILPGASQARMARPEDVASLCAIARTAFKTRFHADPALDNRRCNDLYVEWTRNSCAGGADIVLVADRFAEVPDDRGVARVPVGFVTVNLDGLSSQIGLIAVAADFRGVGVGSDLVTAALDWAYVNGARTMSVVTQGRNVGALRTFESCGFRITNTSLWFHKHYGDHA